jgi:ADP-ribose pyrophosphatase
MWQTVSSREIFSHPRLTLVEDEVLLPNGHRTNYLKYADTGVSGVTVIAVRDGLVLVQREYSYPSDRILLQFPGGGVPAGEDPAIGANRELMEEAGFRAESLRPLGSYLVDNRRSTVRMHAFLATNLCEASLSGDLEEDIETLWYSESEIDALIRGGEIIHAHMLAAWSLYKARE